MSDAPARLRAIVAGHGNFAPGLVSAVEQITGRGAQLVAVTVQGMPLSQIEGLLREQLVSQGIQVVFTDLHAGSCTMAARRILRGLEGTILIAGANLPMLLDFVMADGPSATEAATHAAERGRAAVSIHTGGGAA
jgi:N-acetylgalactosamine PTS system EIIA component